MTEPTATVPKDTQAILNSPTLIVGPSQSGKSTLLGTFAEYVWAKYQKVTLYYLVDGGGFPVQVQELVNRGIIRLWKVRTRSAPGAAIENFQRMGQGFWPRRINPRTGEVDPTVELVPPVTISFNMLCPNGHVVMSAPVQAGLGQRECPTCKLLTGPHNMKVQKTSVRTRGFEQVGAVVMDGISSSGDAIMDDLAHRELGGEKGNLGGTVISGDMRFGSNNRAHYGFAQNRCQQMVLSSMSIPGLVIPAVWTALLQEGADDGGLQVKGPRLPGQAALTSATQWFGDTLETRVFDREAKRIRAIHLESWMEPGAVQPIRHICGVRSFPGRLPAVIEEVQGVDVPLTKFNLGYFYEQRAMVAQQIADEYRQRFADAPGLPEGDTEYGDAPVQPVVLPNVSTGPTMPVTGPAPRPSAPRVMPAVGVPPAQPSQPAAVAVPVAVPVAVTAVPQEAAAHAPVVPVAAVVPPVEWAAPGVAGHAAPAAPQAQQVVRPPTTPSPRRRIAPAVGAVQPVATATSQPGPVAAAAPMPVSGATTGLPPSAPAASVLNAPAPAPIAPPPAPTAPVRAAVPPPPGRRPS